MTSRFRPVFRIYREDCSIDTIRSFVGRRNPIDMAAVRKAVLFAHPPTVRSLGLRTSPMAAETSFSRTSNAAAMIPWRGLLAAAVALAVGWGGMAYAANNSVQGAPKKEDGGFDGDAPTAILMEATSGSVLFEKSADELRAPSSMMKLMTVEVVFNAIKEGKVKLTDEYRISEIAWRKGGAPAGGSTMFAALNSKVSVDDLLHGAIIQSGNDSCIALAEGMAGNERIFAADFLTKRARELGLTRSTFGNSNGLPDPANKMTVRELGKLARHLILTYPDMYKLFGEKEFTWNKIRQQNRNPLLNSLNGADGLKTGFTKEAGYGLVGSSVQNGLRLIAVVTGVSTAKERADEAKKLLEWGFRNFETRTLFAANQQVGYAIVFGGESRSVKLASPEPIKVMVPKNGSEKLIARIVYNGPVRAPVQAGQPVGIVRVWRGANIAVESPVYAAEAIGTGSTMRRAIDGASELVIGMFRASAEKL
jgi:D-alanyl-D-alanine carboxypeptidase (penicillin-binding protein 5/6)